MVLTIQAGALTYSPSTTAMGEIGSLIEAIGALGVTDPVAEVELKHRAVDPADVFTVTILTETGKKQINKINRTTKERTVVTTDYWNATTVPHRAAITNVLIALLIDHSVEYARYSILP